MGSLFRSEEMTLCQLFLQSEAAYACISELGELGLVQFRDLNPDVNAFQRKFVNEVRRCDEMERKLRFLEKEIKKDDIPMLDTGDNPDAPAPREMIDLEATFEKLENEMKEVNANSEALKRNYLELTELKHILRKTQTFFEEAEYNYYDQAATDPSLADESMGLLVEEQSRSAGQQALRLGFVAGVILRERIPAFERMLWRACRGNVFLKQAEIDTPLEDPVTGDQVNKSVFIIFFQGEQLKSRVNKICEGFRASLYPCPETPAERREMAIGVMTRIEDLNTVLQQTQDHRQRVLVAAAKNIKVWFIKVRKIKAIYHTLNMFNLDVTQKCLIGECWCPVADLDKIQLALRRGTERSGSSVPSILNRMMTKQAPPTYNRTNKFTEVFQGIVDAYGVADYREVNPAPFAIISFPFLFSVMFGDAGHGVIMLLFGLWMVVREKQLIAQKSDNEIWNIFFGGRYIILLMGGFSVYSGMLYNDTFSKSLNIFGSSWNAQGKYYPVNNTAKSSANVTPIYAHPVIQLTSRNDQDYIGMPYAYGIDPVWQLALNQITFLNSYKMKLSVIMGITQMVFGICLSFVNHRFFRKPINILFEFLPQIIFINCIFGYLIILIVYKWLAYSEETSCNAPSLLIQLINMFLMTYKSRSGGYKDCGPAPPGAPDNPPLGTSLFYTGQQGFQTFLLLLGIFCVPWMLFPKPFLLKRQHEGKRDREYRAADQVSIVESLNTADGSAVEVTHHDEGNPSTGSATRQAKVDELRFLEAPQESLSVQSGDIMDSGDRQEVTHNEAGSGKPDPQLTTEFDFADAFINQAIHTIEYCLGCISHTASYLRLWALSLAHAELSLVLWSMVMRIGLSMNGYVGSVGVFMVFAPWAVLTVGVLLLMEGLSAFLHTLRLHWVEFQSKFYHGDGYAFVPFSFKPIIDGTIED